jgi:hypothetical protein
VIIVLKNNNLNAQNRLSLKKNKNKKPLSVGNNITLHTSKKYRYIVY